MPACIHHLHFIAVIGVTPIFRVAPRYDYNQDKFYDAALQELKRGIFIYYLIFIFWIFHERTSSEPSSRKQ